MVQQQVTQRRICLVVTVLSEGVSDTILFCLWKREFDTPSGLEEKKEENRQESGCVKGGEKEVVEARKLVRWSQQERIALEEKSGEKISTRKREGFGGKGTTTEGLVLLGLVFSPLHR